MQITVAELVAQLQQFDGNLPVEGFAHNPATQLQLYSVDFEEEFVDPEEEQDDDMPACVCLHYNVV